MPKTRIKSNNFIFTFCQFYPESAHLKKYEVQKALLKYCELDTLSMVMIWEYWEKEITALAQG
jgi:hypothetical protein